jgi:hypothetical protein
VLRPFSSLSGACHTPLHCGVVDAVPPSSCIKLVAVPA